MFCLLLWLASLSCFVWEEGRRDGRKGADKTISRATGREKALFFSRDPVQLPCYALAPDRPQGSSAQHQLTLSLGIPSGNHCSRSPQAVLLSQGENPMRRVGNERPETSAPLKRYALRQGQSPGPITPEQREFLRLFHCWFLQCRSSKTCYAESPLYRST
jgi:hypothetical protein